VLDTLAEYCAVAVSGEFSVGYGLIAAALLLRTGVGRWSLAPLGFVVMEPLEYVLKEIVRQPPPPTEFYRHIDYGLTVVVLSGSFPSGHAMRGAFLLVFLAVLIGVDGPLRDRLGHARARVSQGACVIAALLFGLSRNYLGYHWPSDVLAGFILGGSLALLVGVPVAQRLSTRRQPTGSDCLQ
jgi:undecaprenyl-diphosphatase